MSGMNLTQEERRLNGVGSGMCVIVRNRLDVRKRKGRMSVRSGMSVGVGNRLNTRREKVEWHQVRNECGCQEST